MYLTEEEMNYIFDSSTEKARTSPLIVRVLGKTPEEKQNEEVEIPNLTDHNQDDPLL